MKNLPALLFFLAICLFRPADAADMLEPLKGYEPPPMFEDAQPATPEKTVTEKPIIAKEDDYFTPSFTPPVPPRRPKKFSLSKTHAQKLRKDFEAREKAQPYVAGDRTDRLERKLVSPSAQDVLDQIQ